ncbi:ribosomal rna-processing protein 15 [Ilyonectria robusta]
MAGQVNKKRRTEGRQARPSKKQRRSQAYNSDSEGEEAPAAEAPDFDAFNLLDSDDDIHNARVDDVGGSGDEASSSDEEGPALKKSAAAHEASKAAVDTALEAKARKQIREQKKRAMEKGRVKDVLVATAVDTTGELETTTSEIMVTERRLRKVAQRGVVKLFNAVRAAQVKAVEAEQTTRKTGVIGMNRREEKVNEMSKKGFLDLIASGGGGLKKGGLEEA